VQSIQIGSPHRVQNLPIFPWKFEIRGDRLFLGLYGKVCERIIVLMGLVCPVPFPQYNKIEEKVIF